MKCKDCRWFEEVPSTPWRGSCHIELPRWMETIMGQIDANLGRANVKADGGCDLGQPITKPISGL